MERSLLAISLSRDGLNFDCVDVLKFVAPPKRFEGRAKSVGYQYPHSVVVGDALRVMYSIDKEDIEVMRVPIAEAPEWQTGDRSRPALTCAPVDLVVTQHDLQS